MQRRGISCGTVWLISSFPFRPLVFCVLNTDGSQVGVAPLARLQYSLEQYRQGIALLPPGRLDSSFFLPANATTSPSGGRGGDVGAEQGLARGEVDETRLLPSLVVPQASEGMRNRCAISRFPVGGGGLTSPEISRVVIFARVHMSLGREMVDRCAGRELTRM